MRREGIVFEPGFYRRVWRTPGRSEDWVNLARFLRPNEKVLLIDIGANVGDFTSEFLSIYKDGRSVCFEPVRTTFDRLAKRFSGDRRVVTHRCALSDNDGKATIYLQEDDTLCSLGEYTEEANAFYQTAAQQSEETVCSRLDGFAFEKDGGKLLVKIDVQGFEGEVIRGGMKTIALADVVLLECSFANEYADKEPSFSSSCTLLRECGLYPIVFQDFGRALSNYAFERDVIFVKRALLDRIWLRSHGVARAARDPRETGA
jgi:FkbM family methyltransferase